MVDLVYNQQGASAFKKGEYEQALEYFDKASQYNPQLYLYNKAEAEYRRNNYVLAEKGFINSLNSEDPAIRLRSLYNLGNVYYRLNDLDKAVEYYERALSIDPHYKAAELNRDFVKKKQQEEEKKGKSKETQKDNEDNKSDQKQENKDDSGKSEDKENKKEDDPNNGQDREPANSKEGKPENPESKNGSENNQEKQNNDNNKPPETNDLEANNSEKNKQAIDRILQSIDDDTGKAIQQSILKEKKGNSKQIEKPW